MPEGDAVLRTAQRLHEALAGEVVTDWELRWPGAPTTSARGRRTVGVVARGKHLLHRLDDGTTLHTHLRMEGRWRVRRPDQVRPSDLRDPRLRALIGTTRATALGIELGMLDVVATRDEHHLVGHLGPDLLGADWDAAAAVANLLGAPGRPIGAALLDQRNLAGIGTIWLAETLFTEGVHPWSPVGDLGAQLEAVVDRAHRLLTGTMRFSTSVSTGIDRDGERTFAFGRTALPCRRCAGTIRVSRIGEPPQDRVMYYCPACQGGLGPTDDGRPQQRPGPVRARPLRDRATPPRRR